jgi:hypothetical protein
MTDNDTQYLLGHSFYVKTSGFLVQLELCVRINIICNKFIHFFINIKLFAIIYNYLKTFP